MLGNVEFDMNGSYSLDQTETILEKGVAELYVINGLLER